MSLPDKQTKPKASPPWAGFWLWQKEFERLRQAPRMSDFYLDRTLADEVLDEQDRKTKPAQSDSGG